MKQDSQANGDLRPAPSRGLTELIGKALLDEQLRGRIFADPDDVARQFQLAPAERDALKLLDRATFDRSGAHLRSGPSPLVEERRSAGKVVSSKF